MARRYKKQSKAGLRILCVVLALILAACTLGGLELWGTGKMKPSKWFKKDELAPVTISLADDAAPIGAAQTLENGTRAYALSAAYTGYPSTKRATATCTLPEGGSPDRYEWEITGGEGLSVKTMNADGSAADVTAQTYFSGSATLTARAYRGDELRGIGSINLNAEKTQKIKEINIIVYFYDTEGLPGTLMTTLQDYTATSERYIVHFVTAPLETIEQINEAPYDKVIFLDTDGLIADEIAPHIEELSADFIFIDNGVNRDPWIERQGYYAFTPYIDENAFTENLDALFGSVFQQEDFDGTIEYLHDPNDASPVYNAIYNTIENNFVGKEYQDYNGDTQTISLEPYDPDKSNSVRQYRCVLLQNIADLENEDFYFSASNTIFIIADYFEEVEEGDYETKFKRTDYMIALKRTYDIDALVQWAAGKQDGAFWQYTDVFLKT